ncbi:hypothetical protein [Cytophaga aurantiaca]|uniref:hypothetical protein n=1 Tax=Cytophaga aurantiaca TaxID=29530 RepID=UPI0003615B88|nr:hypothetical protein [Cytophaga aurantiaca]
MIKRNIFTLILLFLTLVSFGQSDTPSRKIVNIGTFIGIGGASISPIPTLDLRYRGTTLRIAPGYKYNGLGITQELFPLSKSFYNVYWLASAYYVQGTQENVHPNVTTDYTSISGLVGLKYYMGTRFFSELQLGIENRKKTTPGYDATTKTSPYFEFGIGINLFRNYPKKTVVINADE